MAIFGGCFLIILLIFLINKYFNDHKYYNPDDFFLKKVNKKYLLGAMIFIVVLSFILISYFIYDVLPYNRKVVSLVLIIGLGIIELILVAFVITNPYFQNSENFVIHEMLVGDRKVIYIRYKDYEFELFDILSI